MIQQKHFSRNAGGKTGHAGKYSIYESNQFIAINIVACMFASIVFAAIVVDTVIAVVGGGVCRANGALKRNAQINFENIPQFDFDKYTNCIGLFQAIAITQEYIH